MSSDKSDTISYLEEACSRADEIRRRLYDLRASITRGAPPRKGSELTLDCEFLTGVLDTAGLEALAAEDLRDSLRTLIDMIKQSAAEK